MKHFSVTFPDGSKEEFTKAQAYLANNLHNYGAAGATFMVKGKVVTEQEFQAEAAALLDAAWAKKEETHKRVRVLYGSSVACYVEKWVRR